MAAVAVASQSAPPETRCSVDTAGPVLGINDLYRINPGSNVHCLRLCATSFFLAPLVYVEAAQPSFSLSDFKGTAADR